MQEEVNDKTIYLSVRATKMTAELLKKLMQKFLEEQNKKKQQSKAATQKKKDAPTRGKQSLKDLMSDQKAEIKNIQITDGNIKSFNRVARKYGIDYSLKKDVSLDPPRYMVFFKAKDIDVMTAAFREYAGIALQKSKKPSVRKKLALAKERVAKHRERTKQHQKERGPER